MRALVQRVTQANVVVDGQEIGAISKGVLILICAMRGDEDSATSKLTSKISKLRIFADEAGKMNKSLIDIGGSALIVSQFTLAADTSSGNRPGFSQAARPDEGNRLYCKFIEEMKTLGIETQTGAFGADMKVSLTNDGPVTIWMDV